MKNSTIEDLYAEKENLASTLTQLQADLTSSCKQLVATIKKGTQVNAKTAFKTWG
jgi:hypothetical protein